MKNNNEKKIIISIKIMAWFLGFITAFIAFVGYSDSIKKWLIKLNSPSFLISVVDSKIFWFIVFPILFFVIIYIFITIFKTETDKKEKNISFDESNKLETNIILGKILNELYTQGAIDKWERERIVNANSELTKMDIDEWEGIDNVNSELAKTDEEYNKSSDISVFNTNVYKEVLSITNLKSINELKDWARDNVLEFMRLQRKIATNYNEYDVTLFFDDIIKVIEDSINDDQRKGTNDKYCALMTMHSYIVEFVSQQVDEINEIKEDIAVAMKENNKKKIRKLKNDYTQRCNHFKKVVTCCTF